MVSRSFSAAIALWIGIAGAAAGADPAAEPAGTQDPESANGAEVGLDTLLRLPPSTAAPEQPRTGGASRLEWEQRFATARGDVAAAQKALDGAQAELGRAAGGSNAWQMSAPGAQPSSENAPVSFKLRQEIRKQREELASAQKRLSELEVEAKLAGVPDEWMGAEPSPPAPKPTQDAATSK